MRRGPLAVGRVSLRPSHAAAAAPDAPAAATLTVDLGSVGEPVADHGDGNDHDHDQRARVERLLGMTAGEAALAVGDHDAPVGRRGLDAEPQERQRGRVEQ